MAELALSGSIEQDAASILLLYREEVYRADTPDRGMCEVYREKLPSPGAARPSGAGLNRKSDEI